MSPARPRTYLVTGAASGIGEATAARLRAQGHTVLGADLAGQDIDADLSTPEGRLRLVDRARELSGGRLDAVIASAGVHLFDPLTVQVNHFGAVATPEGLRPLLAAGTDPRAVVVSSLTAVHPHDPAIADAALAAPEQIAPLLDFLTSPENTHVTGQIVFIDGGADATLRGAGAW